MTGELSNNLSGQFARQLGHYLRGAMNAYTELKDKFDHLQKRTWELFEYGQKREGRLNGAMASVWHEL